MFDLNYEEKRRAVFQKGKNVSNRRFLSRNTEGPLFSKKIHEERLLSCL